ncbi:MAG: Tryptophan synthase alpha chain [Labilithrix sp.]|nr:Tryptophan synthase alpha chain [Labilithrix sp.]
MHIEVASHGCGARTEIVAPRAVLLTIRLRAGRGTSSWALELPILSSTSLRSVSVSSMKRSHCLVWGTVLSVLAAASACGERTGVSIGTDCGDQFCEPGFTPSPDADGGGAAVPSPPSEPLLACIGTECSHPYTTCPGSRNRCDVNLDTDSANCGACGVSCGGLGFEQELKMQGRCASGACVYECRVEVGLSQTLVWHDCNGIFDDGCETDLFSDPENCGTCGKKCPAGVRCVDGQCGCPLGRQDCGGKCIDVRFADKNCGACGVECEPPQERCSPMPDHATHGCVYSECGKFKCEGLFGDCNHDLVDCASDGCETDLSDVNNCGACGVLCAPHQRCEQGADGTPRCKNTCDTLGLVDCPGSTHGCTDLLTDEHNCGTCGVGCDQGVMNQVGACRKGVCSLECEPGFADCNGDPADGCEVDLRSHPGHCGACGNECDQRAGQPCIDGACLMVECDGGVVAK